MCTYFAIKDNLRRGFVERCVNVHEVDKIFSRAGPDAAMDLQMKCFNKPRRQEDPNLVLAAPHQSRKPRLARLLALRGRASRCSSSAFLIQKSASFR